VQGKAIAPLLHARFAGDVGNITGFAGMAHASDAR
jgi:hypothetical protein